MTSRYFLWPYINIWTWIQISYVYAMKKGEREELLAEISTKNIYVQVYSLKHQDFYHSIIKYSYQYMQKQGSVLNKDKYMLQ